MRSWLSVVGEENGTKSEYGIPEVLVSDFSSVFLSHDAKRIYEALGIEKKAIKKGKPWQNYIENYLYIIWDTRSWYNSNNGMTLP